MADANAGSVRVQIDLEMDASQAVAETEKLSASTQNLADIMRNMLAQQLAQAEAQVRAAAEAIAYADAKITEAGSTWIDRRKAIGNAGEEWANANKELEKTYNDLVKARKQLEDLPGKNMPNQARANETARLQELIALLKEEHEKRLAVADAAQDEFDAISNLNPDELQANYAKALKNWERLNELIRKSSKGVGEAAGEAGKKSVGAMNATGRSARELTQKMTLLSRIFYVLRNPRYLTSLHGMSYAMNLLGQAGSKAIAVLKRFAVPLVAIGVAIGGIFSGIKLLSGEVAQLAVQTAKLGAQARAMGADIDLTAPWKAFAEQLDVSNVAMTALRLNTIKSLTDMGATMEEAVAKADQLALMAGQVATLGGPSVRPEDALRAVEQLTAGNAQAFSNLTGIDLTPLQNELQRTQPYLTDLERGAILTEAAMQRLAGVGIKDPVTDLGDAKKIMDDLKGRVGEELAGSFEALARQLVKIADAFKDWEPAIVAVSKAFTWLLDGALRSVNILMAAIHEAIGLASGLVGVVITMANWIPGVDLDEVKEAVDGFTDMQRAVSMLEASMAVGVAPTQALAEGIAWLGESGALTANNLRRLAGVSGLTDRELHNLLLTIREQAKAWGLDAEALTTVENVAQSLERGLRELDAAGQNVNIGGDAYERALKTAEDILKKHNEIKTDVQGGFGLVGAWKQAAAALDAYNKKATHENAVALAQATFSASMMSIEQGPEAIEAAWAAAQAEAKRYELPEEALAQLKEMFDWAADLTNEAVESNEDVRAASQLTKDATRAAADAQVTQWGRISNVVEGATNDVRVFRSEFEALDGTTSTVNLVVNQQGATTFTPSDISVPTARQESSSGHHIWDESRNAWRWTSSPPGGYPTNTAAREAATIASVASPSTTTDSWMNVRQSEQDRLMATLAIDDVEEFKKKARIPTVGTGGEGNLGGMPGGFPSGGGGGQQASLEDIRKLMQEVARAIRIGIEGGVGQGFTGNAIQSGFGSDDFLTAEGGNLQIGTVIIKGVWDFTDPAAKRRIIKELEAALAGLKAEV